MVWWYKCAISCFVFFFLRYTVHCAEPFPFLLFFLLTFHFLSTHFTLPFVRFALSFLFFSFLSISMNLPFLLKTHSETNFDVMGWKTCCSNGLLKKLNWNEQRRLTRTHWIKMKCEPWIVNKDRSVYYMRCEEKKPKRNRINAERKSFNQDIDTVFTIDWEVGTRA